MKRGVRVAGFGLLMAAAIVLSLSGVGVAKTRVSLTPASGSSTTRFVVHFRSPDRTGRIGTLRRSYVLRVTGPKARRCVSAVSVTLRPVVKGHRVTVTLNPKRLGGVWCVGRFRGRITELQRPVCSPHLACPQFIIVLRTVARFSFRVKPATGTSGGGSGTGSQGQGPTFAGLISATTCIVLTPHPLPEGRSYNLIWNPASDPVTPSSGIVYDIYYSPTPGGEDYTDPTWTTAPGATSYTAGVGPGPAYFVVRARDQAGHEDQNTVERAGVSICG
jgi:hypothetical protein